MDVHQNAKFTPRGRSELVVYVLGRGTKYRDPARVFGVDTKTVRRWLQRYLDESFKGLCERSSRPHQPRAPTPRALRRRGGRGYDAGSG